jgi:prophage antirepressor-like protein
MNNTSLSVFSFESNSVRVLEINGEPWFVAKDVLIAINSTTKVTDIEKLIVDELGREFVSSEHLNTAGGKQEMLILSEPALTMFVSRSRTELGKQMNRWIHVEVLPSIRKTGSYSIPQVQQPKLPAHKLAVEITDSVAHIQDTLSFTNPRLAQFLIDHAISEIMPASNSLTDVKLKGVVEIAEEMGFKVNFNNRSQLGKFVKKLCGELSSQEERLVNGTVRSVACYPADSEEVRQAITSFFDR